jgi:hypothetical protein
MQMLETNGTSRRQAQVVRARCSCSSPLMPSVAVLASPKIAVTVEISNSTTTDTSVRSAISEPCGRGEMTPPPPAWPSHSVGHPALVQLSDAGALRPHRCRSCCGRERCCFFTVADGKKGCLIGSWPSAEPIPLSYHPDLLVHM